MPTTDPRNTGSYTIPEASSYLLIPENTLRSWVIGRNYETTQGKRRFHPLIKIANREQALLSFLNLVEAHVLDSLRNNYGLALKNVRRALDTLFKLDEFHSYREHPLANRVFMTDGRNLLIEQLGKLINLTRDGQHEMSEIIDSYLTRVEWAPDGYAAELFPFTRKRSTNEPRSIVINPRVSFGRPVLVGTGIATAVVAERYKAGESIEELAKDYGRADLDIEEAIRCELYSKAS